MIWHKQSKLSCKFYNCKYLRGDYTFNLQLFAGEKTEDPTAKRMQEAKDKGQVARSQDLSAAIVILVGFLSLWGCGQLIYTNLAQFMVMMYKTLGTTPQLNVEYIMGLFVQVVLVLAKCLLPIMLAVMLAGLAFNYYQVGFVFSVEPLSFDLSKLNPITGMGRIFSKRSLVELFKSIAKICVVLYFVYSYILEQVMQMPKLIFMDMHMAMSTMVDIVFKLAFQICGLLTVIGMIDFVYQKWQHKQDLKMSKQDIKDEMKQSEGDPHIKGKIKQKQRQISMQRMMQEVSKADVIVTNPTHFAVALQYEQGMLAPLVVAKGQDFVAQKIKEKARELRITIVEDKPLARALYAAVEIGEYVPQELYKAVAEILAYVYRLKHRKLKKK